MSKFFLVNCYRVFNVVTLFLVASDKEFINCYEVCQEFLQNEALYLQSSLKKKASS